MKFSTQEEYGLRCLVAIAQQENNFMTIPELSDHEGLSESHVAKILSILRKAGFVKSARGQLGGYSLARHPSELILRDILEALGGRLYGDVFCERHTGIMESCVHENDCTLRPLWSSLQTAIDGVLGRYSLQDLVDQRIDPPPIHLSLGPRTANPLTTLK